MCKALLCAFSSLLFMCFLLCVFSSFFLSLRLFSYFLIFHFFLLFFLQFEEAIAESLSPDALIPFNPPKSKLPDFQSIFVNSSVRTPEELLEAVKYLREMKVNNDSLLVASFPFHFQEFIRSELFLRKHSLPLQNY